MIVDMGGSEIRYSKQPFNKVKFFVSVTYVICNIGRFTFVQSVMTEANEPLLKMFKSQLKIVR